MARSFPPPAVAVRPQATARPSPLAPSSQAPVSPPAEVRPLMDFERDKAAPLVPRLERMAEAVGRMGALQTQYQRACTGTIQVDSVDRLGNRTTGTINKAETPQCLNEAVAISDLQAALKKEGAAVQESARTTAVRPGILRDLVATYHLEEYLNP